MESTNALRVLLLLVAVMSQDARGAEFCADLKAKYGAEVLRCVDFAAPLEVAINSGHDGHRAIGTPRFDRTTTATPGATGSLHWKIRSYDRVRAEEPGLGGGAGWMAALWSLTGNRQGWIGIDRLAPGRTYYYQFKLRFNPDVWHEITMALKPGANRYGTNPAVTNKAYKHDTMLKVWYDGQLIVNFDPNEPPFSPFLHHPQVDVYMDDWVVATVPLPMQRRAAGAKVGAGSFGLDARDLDMLPPNTITRLFPGPDKTFYNTGYGRMSASDPYNPNPGTTPEAYPTIGASTLSATNYGVEIPVQSAVPLGGGFVAPQYGAGKMLYFGGGHSGYRANRVNVFDFASGRWSQSKYTPDMGSQIGGAIGPRTPTPPGTGCTTQSLSTSNRFATTGTLSAGSKVVTNIAATANMCPIKGLCPGQNAQTGGYAILGQGLPAEAVILSVDSPTQVTLTHAATASGTVALTGGQPSCVNGGSPNGSTGGRGWWEHMDDRYGWDDRAKAWVLVQNSGTWFYDDVKETWKLASGPWPVGDSMMCGPGDYTAMGVRFAKSLNRMLNWCSTDAIFGYDYGSGPPDYTGAKWVQLHQLAQADRNPNTDVLSQTVWDEKNRRLYHLTLRSSSFYGGTGVWNPILQWFDPATNKSGKFDSTKPNYPQGYSTPVDPVTQSPDKTSPCYAAICQQLTASMTVDRDGNLYIVGARAVDGQIMFWKLTDPLGPKEAWTVLQDFAFNTYDAKNLQLVGGEFDTGSSRLGIIHYIPERDLFMLIVRSGSGNGGASTRGGTCLLNGQPDDCFRMYGLRLRARGSVAAGN